MSVFSYTALSSTGEKITGELDARNRAEAHRKLDREKLQPVTLELKGAPETSSLPAERAEAKLTGSLYLTRSQIIQFTEELGDLLEAGLRLEPALRIMENRQELSGLKSVIAVAREQVVQGTSFSAALQSASPSFGELYCSMALAGELSGALAQILRRQSRYLSTMEDLHARVLEALIYPAFIAGVGVLLLGIFMTVLIPQLTVLFVKTGQTLPWATRLLVKTSSFAARDWWVILLGMALLATAFWQVVKRPSGRLWWDEWKLKVPFTGAILTARFYAQCAQTLATLVTNGVTLLQALRLMAGATPNVHLRKRLSQALELVAHGASLSRAMKQAGHFPAVFIDVVTVGEQTGRLGEALERAAQRYDKELNQKIKRMTALIQPVVIIIMALVVGAIAYAIMTGIFQSVSGLQFHRR